jgi:(E)-4-hydroxy-3-methylbut-2-enyl-diphosphate synthase
MMANSEHDTRQIEIGGLKLGGGAPVVVQSMCTTRTVDIDETVKQVNQLANAGAGIVRIALTVKKRFQRSKRSVNKRSESSCR